ncbi:AAA family ATPase, partial [Candidatus Saccharibacteria bacterium]|nr:AAA family ATPase [Candidatus Saccharibacteria bacterium]
MEIKREKYLKELQDREWNGQVKVITGCRRSGKSYLLFKIFKEYLVEKGVAPDVIIELALDQIDNEALREPHALYGHLIDIIKDKRKRYYIMLDEIQYVDRFDEVLNSLARIENVDVYVTGSNSKLLSKDVLTSFRGRGDEIRLHPLSFAEYMENYDGESRKAWQEYLLYGGLPRTLALSSDDQKAKYLKDLFE